MPRTVLQGSTEEAEVKAETEAALRMPVTAPPITADTAPNHKEVPDDGYQKITVSEIPENDRKNPALAAALKIVPGCELYEKEVD